MRATKEGLLAEMDRRVADHILEPSNAELLKKLIRQADTDNEAMMIAELGTTYKRTGLHFDPRLEHMTDDIHYFRRNEALSFRTDDGRPTHKLIIGDNYPALQNLLVEYRGRVDVVYIDPPYGKDSMGEFAKTNYENAITRDNLLSMLWPRLQLAKQLLSDSGVIFCSIDDRNQAYVKCLFDDVFGEKNFINSFVWQKNSSEKTDKTQFTVNTEYIVLYSKSSDYILHDTYKPLSEASIKLYKYDDNDGRGKYATVSLQKPSSPGPETTYDYIDNNNKVWPCPPKGWRMTYDKIKALENDNRLVFSGTSPRVKDYWNERKSEGKRIDTLWSDLPQNTAGSSQLHEIFGNNPFDNPKPIELIKRCIDIANNDAIVLDFFAGSGTTGHAVLELNRSERQDGDLMNEKKPEGQRTFILCQLNEKTDTTPNGIAYDVTAKRLKRIMTGTCYDGTSDFDWLTNNHPYGGSLDVYDIGTVGNFEAVEGKTPFDVIDETLYGQPPFGTLRDKVDWVCNNFVQTQMTVEDDAQWLNHAKED